MTLDFKHGINLTRAALLSLVLATPLAVAREEGPSGSDAQRYIVELRDPPLAAYRGQSLSVPADDGRQTLAATTREKGGGSRLVMASPEARDYLKFITARHREFQSEASLQLGRPLKFVHQYRVASNGMALDLSPAEARILAKSPLVKSLSPDRHHRLDTYAGPPWIGAEDIWDGLAGFPEKRGEGIVVGNIDSGINWDHPSFGNPSVDGYTHVNPYEGYLGLCADVLSPAQCNGKIVGIYDMVEDNPFTENVTENFNDGKDDDEVGHGSHTAGISVGNPLNTFYAGFNVDVSGVAPRANLISYRVCFPANPDEDHEGGCAEADILAAIDQAVADGVDVINYSIGAPPIDPWRFGSVERAFLNARDVGIFVATSAGNEGPFESTIRGPANAPWVVAVGSATHNVTPGSVVQDLNGGDTPPPGDLGGASATDGIGVRKIVHARDFGSALCGVGEAELQGSCETNQGLSNPWEGQTPFDGEIVVCDRGTYGRVEKSKNVMLAGAGGYILANSSQADQNIVADEFCVPGIHIDQTDGDRLREWLSTGSGHEGSIASAQLVESDAFGDSVNPDSSRGPNLPPVEDILKPNLIAPGVNILSASNVGQNFRALTGTSMSSPHVAGAAALLKSVHPDWSVSQLASAIETTATAELATDRGIGGAASAQVWGAGRPVLGDAANTGMYLDVTTSDFISANPDVGGEPGELNLPGLLEANCAAQCSISRTLTDQKGGGNWSAEAVGFPDDVTVTVAPESFALGNGQSRSIEVIVDLDGSGIFNEWVEGRIRLRSTGSPDQFLTVSVYSAGGELPESKVVSTDRNSGWQEMSLSGLVAMPDATYTSGGLVRPESTSEKLVQDPTEDDPFDGGEGVFTVWHSAPGGIMWLYAETLASTSFDLDLYVGADINGDGEAQAWEELCSSTSPDELEECELFELPPGDYWILVQNWQGNLEGGDVATLVHAAVQPSVPGNFAATGPGITTQGEEIPLRLSWDNIDALPGEEYFGAVAVGTSRDQPYNIGLFPVRLVRTGISEPETLPLMNGSIHRLALAANSSHDRMFIDVPPGASQLTVEAGGADDAQNNGLKLELKRLDFADALDPPPFAASPADAPVLVSAQGTGGVGPSITVIGVEPGRWYAVLTNLNGSGSRIQVRATAQFEGTPIKAQPGLWYPGSRPDVMQGYEYNQGSGAGTTSQALVWYTYDEAGQPAWYIAGGTASTTNIWTAELLRFTNDGAQQQSTKVGYLSVANLGEKEQMFSYTLFGESGSERMLPISGLTCPQSGMSYTGLWYPGFDGLGGASVLVNAQTQSQIHYLFDGIGVPRWLVAQDLENPEPENTELPMLQFSGYCAVCEATEVTSGPVGVLQRTFSSEIQGSWTLDYMFAPPLTGSVERTDAIQKLTDRTACQ